MLLDTRYFVRRQLIVAMLCLIAVNLLSKTAYAADPEAVAKKILIHKTLADIYSDKSNFPEASKEYQALFALDSSDAQAHYNYGRLLASNNQSGPAVSQFKAAAKLEPGKCEYQGGLGLACMYAKDYDGAALAFTKACALGCKQYQKYLQSALQYQAQRKQLEQYNQKLKQQNSGDDDE